ncbi:MAG TPA: enoyl-CoA hydratase/isomerase family protein [Acidimicrobiales bacterium]|nr:enoyl-CoA hydratase/isomerase family protein [Acidimicrobiales bacterium]
MTDTVVGVRREGLVAIVELSRSKVNAIDVELMEQLGSTLDRLEHDPGVGALVLTGTGRVFSAGVDLRTVVDAAPGYAERLVTSLRHGLEALFCFPKPTVAAVNGAAVAGGCILACACDRRLMADTARIGASELAVGVPFPVAALEIVRHACGSRTEDVVYSARLFDADEANTIGMIHEVHSPDVLLERAVAVAAEFATRSPLAYRLAKAQLRGPVLDRMRSAAGALADKTAIDEWAAPHTARNLRQQLERLAAAR